MKIPTLVIAGVSSGVGKTSLTLGLVRAFSRRGMRVQPFKVGPDFLDPTYLSRAAGRPCYNLDGWMGNREHVQQLFSNACADADLAIIEGVMGLFDGSDPASNTGSTAEIAAWLGAGVVLVVHAHGMARSVVPVAKGFAEFDPSVNLVGVIANHVGSPRHVSWLRSALASEDAPKLLGAVPRNSLPSLPSRHLGLVTANEQTFSDATLDELADACEKHLDLDAILSAAKPIPVVKPTPRPLSGNGSRVRLGVARDEAFHFAYPENLSALVDSGADLVFFSPLSDAALPEGLDGIYIPGGYPELFAAPLAENRSMRESIRQFGQSGSVVYGECGGLMYLGRSIVDEQGAEHEMVGLAPITTRKLDRLKTLGYVEATLREPCLWGTPGAVLRGHEFHYSEIVNDDLEAEGFRCAYALQRRKREGKELEGFVRDNLMLSYIHLYWASSPSATAAFIDRCRKAVER